MKTARRVAVLALLTTAFALTATGMEEDKLPAGARARLGSKLLRHGDKIFFLAFTAEGKRLVTASHDSSIRVWDAATGRQLHRLELPAVDGGAARLNLGGGMMIGNMSLNTAPRVMLAPDGKHVAALTQGKLFAWELDKGAKMQEWKGVSASDIAFADDKSIVSLGSGGTRTTWNLVTGKSEGGGGGLLNLLIGGGSDGLLAPDGKQAAIFQQTGLQQPEMSLVIKDLVAGKERHTIKLGAGGVQIAGFSNDGQLFAWIGIDSSIHLLDVATGKELEAWQNHRASATITGLRFSCNGKLLALADDDGVVRVCATQTGKVLKRIGAREAQPAARAMVFFQTSFGGAGQPKSGLAFSPDDKQLAASFGAAGVRLFDVESGEEKSVSSGGHRDTVSHVAVAADGKSLVSLDRNGDCLLWDLGTNKEQRRQRLGEQAELSADGRWAVSARGAEIQVVDTRTSKPVGAKIDVGQVMLRALAVSPDGKLVATRTSGIDIWEVASGRRLRSFAAPANAGGGLQPVFVNLSGVLTPALTFSPDGRLIAGAGGEQQLGVWNVDTGEAVCEISLPKEQIVQQLTFTPNGSCLVVLGEDHHCADVYEIATGTKRLRLGKPVERKGEAVEAAVMINGMTFSLFGNDARPAVAVSPDGRLLALGDGKGAIHLWDLFTGTEGKSLAGHEGAITSLAFSPDGRTLFSGSKDTTLLVWDLPPREGKTNVEALEARKLEELWTALGSAEAAPAWTALVELSRQPQQAAELVKKQLRPVAAPDDKEVARLIAELDDEAFEVREKARGKLVGFGELAAPALKKALAGDVTLEVKQQLERLISQAGRVAASGDSLRSARALELLELTENREVLKSLAKGAEGASLTRAARAALARLGAR